MSITRNLFRVAAIIAALIIGGAQNQFFPCNKMPFLSLAGGVVTVLLIYATIEGVFTVAVAALSLKTKLLVLPGIVLVGLILATAAGFFTLFTHICP